jgi:NADH:ubiquinone oxidoreductase subunit
VLNLLASIFTWWNSATIGIRFTIAKSARLVGTDDYGNKYFEATSNKGSYDARKRRYVIYRGYAEASKIPPDWHGWMHYTFDEPPTVAPLKRRAWELDHRPNLTGTIHAWRPKGAIGRGGVRAPATGDYEAWKPE